jgi:FHA domain-containing protein
MRRLILALLDLGLLIGWGLPVRAQGQAHADLYPADASAFPSVSAFLDVFDGSERFVSGLKPGDVTVVEDGRPLPVRELNEMVVPAQIAVAVNPGPALGVRDSQGTTRFQHVVQVLGAWAQALPADNPPDDMSLVTIAGPVILHANAKDWAVSLGAFQPDFRSTTPNLQSLATALETVSVQPPRVGMKRAVLFITPHMDDPNIDSLVRPLIERAIQNRVHIFVWFVDTDLYTATTSAAAFNMLAVQTGGGFFSATTAQPYPDPEAYFAPLRRLYSLKYDSAVEAGGSHTFSVDVRSPVGEIKSPDQAFTVDIQPPNPIFVSPPLQITRQAPADDPYNDKILVPAAQEIGIIVEFPDGHPRDLVRTTLYVDGQIMDENKTAPFDKFSWDLGNYDMSSDHKMVVEAVDSLGLSKTSMEIPVTVTVIQPPRGLAAFFAKYRQYITVGSVGLAGLALLLIILMSRMSSVFSGTRASRRAQADPVTQSVPVAVEVPESEKQKKPRRRRPAGTNAKVELAEAPAYLQRLTPDLQPAAVSPIPLATKEITFGADPVQSMYVLDDPSLAARHARLVQGEDGGFLLADAGSVAGTWVNFEQVGKEGQPLRHGDVVHFGQLVFRFELKDPPAAEEPKIVKENPAP